MCTHHIAHKVATSIVASGLVLMTMMGRVSATQGSSSSQEIRAVPPDSLCYLKRGAVLLDSYKGNPIAWIAEGACVGFLEGRASHSKITATCWVFTSDLGVCRRHGMRTAAVSGHAQMWDLGGGAVSWVRPPPTIIGHAFSGAALSVARSTHFVSEVMLTGWVSRTAISSSPPPIKSTIPIHTAPVDLTTPPDPEQGAGARIKRLYR